MAQITHFEVYTDNGDGWKLLNRFALEQRSQAFSLAKEKEQEKLGVKVIRESFDVFDNTYLETVEYVKNLKGKKKNPNINYIHTAPFYTHHAVKEKINATKVIQALVILLSIIALSVVVANLFATLSLPILEMLFPEEVTRTIFFIGLFVGFILVALPLMLKKMPWHDLVITTIDNNKVDDDIFYEKAETIIARYNLNDDFSDDVTPTFPEANVEHKKEIVSFLAQILSILSLNTIALTNFNKLGVKLIVYGGCLELAKYNHMYINQANSLLQEAFNIIDGQSNDLSDFYEAKRTYSDNKVAIFLTGIGAYIMDRALVGQPIDKNILTKGFKRWENIDKEPENNYNAPISKNHDAMINNLVSIKRNIQFFDNNNINEAKIKTEHFDKINTIINNLIKKYNGSGNAEQAKITTISFASLHNGIAFAQEFAKDITNYLFEINNDNIIFNIKVNLIKEQANNSNEDYIKDIFNYANDDEVLTTQNIVKEVEGNETFAKSFISIGTKLLETTGKKVELFKIV